MKRSAMLRPEMTDLLSKTDPALAKNKSNEICKSMERTYKGPVQFMKNH